LFFITYLLFEKWNNVGREKFFGGNLGRGTKKIEKHCVRHITMMWKYFFDFQLLTYVGNRYYTISENFSLRSNKYLSTLLFLSYNLFFNTTIIIILCYNYGLQNKLITICLHFVGQTRELRIEIKKVLYECDLNIVKLGNYFSRCGVFKCIGRS